MKLRSALLILVVSIQSLFAGNVEKTYSFSNLSVTSRNGYDFIVMDHTLLSGITGEPAIPYHQVALLLPPGESAVELRFSGEELTPIPGIFHLWPQQPVQPISKGSDNTFRKNETVYLTNGNYPKLQTGTLFTAFLNGYSFALSTFTPVVYNPVTGSLSYYKRVTIQVVTQPDAKAAKALANLPASKNALQRALSLAQNPASMALYPSKSPLKSAYEILIITPQQFQEGYADLVNYYNSINRPAQIATTELINSSMTGQDQQEKIRNYIIQEYQTNGIEQVILGGDIEHVPYRGFYCYVISGSGYEDFNIPADLYYSALDGNWNTNGDNKWGEPGEDDLLPELSVGRMSFSTSQELENMVHKSVSYQSTPVEEEMKHPFMVSEFLYDPPMTWGSDYLELLIDDHSDNGYFTHGIPSLVNTIDSLYDSPSFSWGTTQLLNEINKGKSFIHHSGHSNSNYMMRLYNWDITNQNFSKVDGIQHNYQLMYTHGCICGAFDDNDCISEKATTISNWLVGGIFNSRYGWFNQGETEGPSAHLHREFISALYHPDPDSACPYLGTAHTMSKIKTAPWVGLPGEFEPGAQRWCFYDCNVLGDPALKVWIDNPSVGIGSLSQQTRITLSPNPATEFVNLSFDVQDEINGSITVLNALGQELIHMTGKEFIPGENTVRMNIKSLPTGLYFVRIDTPEFSQVRKLMIK
ncbi:MAG TPA: C25 family cysteine peptidase [Bacteroidales bacterium]|nr:C25 family cysteine peptidase [Bacteroidales bacterium]HPS49828.1 C25 family cysteine peptidase [Bacteroidales bacterium]